MSLVTVAAEYSPFNPTSFRADFLGRETPEFTIAFPTYDDYAAAVQHGTGKPPVGNGRLNPTGVMRLHDTLTPDRVLLQHFCYAHHADCWNREVQS